MKPITHGDKNTSARLGKVCKCTSCGVEATCDRNFDFYTRKKDGKSGPLYCYACLCRDANTAPIFNAYAPSHTTLPN